MNFRILKSFSQQHSSYSATKRISHGRPEDLDSSRAFQQMAAFYRENDDEQLTLQEFLKGSECHAHSQVYIY